LLHFVVAPAPHVRHSTRQTLRALLCARWRLMKSDM
jgi:hypothetical protein